ncbi:MAG: mevalonate kinase family protein [Bacteroidia bacterium]
MRVFGKILLFGEYAILDDSNALAVPSTNYFGELKLNANTPLQLDSHVHLLSFANFLETKFQPYFDITSLEADLHQKLYFDSNIPQGYGVGSSATVVAAFLKRYGKAIPETLEKKKALFGDIESHFHGKSSGLDVMVCYENAPVLIQNSRLKIEHSVHENDYCKFELIDTKEIGLTSELVNEFKGQNSKFKECFRKDYVNSTNRAIDYFLMGNEAKMFAEMKKLSLFAFEHMPFTIPDSFKPQWEASLNDENTVMKLCGSGGGGFVLRYALGG